MGFGNHKFDMENFELIAHLTQPSFFTLTLEFVMPAEAGIQLFSIVLDATSQIF